MKINILNISFFASLLFASNVYAIAPPSKSDVYYGYTDLRQTIDIENFSSTQKKKITLNTKCCSVGVGFLSMDIDVFTDQISITFRTTSRNRSLEKELSIAALAYIIPSENTDEKRVIVAYGVDLNPKGTLGPMTGFSADDPEIKPVSSEVFTTKSGESFKGETYFLSIDEFKEKYPNLDLSANFYSAEPNSLVMISEGLIPSKYLENF